MKHIGYNAETIKVSVDGEVFTITNFSPQISDSERKEVKEMMQKKLYNVFQKNIPKVNN